jgi:hypothetical protein
LIGPIPIDWVWLGLIGSIAKIRSWIGTDGNRQNHVTTSPHHCQGVPLGQREKRKRNCSFHH